MLKSWKQAWKKEDGSAKGVAKVHEGGDVPPVHDYSTSLTSRSNRRTSTNSTPSKRSASPVPMMRTRTLSEVESDDVDERPIKRQRANAADKLVSPGAIHSRLPEILDVEEEVESNSDLDVMSIEEFEDSLVAQAKSENSEQYGPSLYRQALTAHSSSCVAAFRFT